MFQGKGGRRAEGLALPKAGRREGMLYDGGRSKVSRCEKKRRGRKCVILLNLCQRVEGGKGGRQRMQVQRHSI